MTIHAFLAVLRSRWTIAGPIFAITLGAAIAVAVLMPARYAASARVLVGAEARDPAYGTSVQAAAAAGHMATQVDIVTSQRVALKVVEALRLAEDPEAVRAWREASGGTGSIRHHLSDRLLAALDVRQAGSSSVLTIRFVAPDPARAAAGANAFADAYAELMGELAGDAAADAPAAAPAGAATARRAVRPDVVVLSRAIAPTRPASPRPGPIAGAGALLAAVLAFAGALVAERSDRRVRGARDLQRASGVSPMCTLRDAFGGAAGQRPYPGTPAAGERPTADPADADGLETRPLPSARTGPRPPGAGGPDREPPGSTTPTGPLPIGQIMVSAGLIHPPEVERILEWARADGVRFGEAAVAHRLVTEEQVERALARQFDFPVLDAGSSRVSAEVVAAFDARNPLVADLRRLRARIRSAQLAAPPDAPLKTFAVISSGTGDGKTFVSANLAVTFAQAGQRTLLVDADLRRGRQHRVFGLDNRIGLSSMLNRRIEPGSLQQVPGLPDLRVVTCGPAAPNPSELLSRDVFGHLLASFARAYDVVILDTPGVAEEPDAMLIGQRAGAALVIARKDRSAFDAVVELVHPGGAPAVPVIGSVLNAA